MAETLQATVIGHNQAIRLRARKECLDRQGIRRVTGSTRGHPVAPGDTPGLPGFSPNSVASVLAGSMSPCASGVHSLSTRGTSVLPEGSPGTPWEAMPHTPGSSSHPPAPL